VARRSAKLALSESFSTMAAFLAAPLLLINGTPLGALVTLAGIICPKQFFCKPQVGPKALRDEAGGRWIECGIRI
jgi:hypothetical protein